MRNELLLSIVIPAYNMELYIKDTLMSIYNQEGKVQGKYETIVVDDGSKDATSQVVNCFREEHPGFNLTLLRQENKGVSAARNNGLRVSKGKYVWFVDGDDAITSNSIAHILDIIDHYAVDVIKIGPCISDVLLEDGTVLPFEQSVSFEKGESLPAYHLLNISSDFGHQTFLWKRNLLLSNSLFYPEDMTWNEDYCFLCHALLKADKVYRNQTCRFYLYRSMAESTSRGKYDFWKFDKFFANRILLLQKMKELECGIDKIEVQKYFNEKFTDLKSNTIKWMVLNRIDGSIILYYCKKMRLLGIYPEINKTNIKEAFIGMLRNGCLVILASRIITMFRP